MVELHSTVSPPHTKVPKVSGVVCHDTASFTAEELAGGSTAAYRKPLGTTCCSCPSLIWNNAASTGSPRTAGPTVPLTSERRYWWKLGSSYRCYSATFHIAYIMWTIFTTARMNESPGISVGVAPAAALDVEDGPVAGLLAEVTGAELDGTPVPCRHCE